MSAVTDRAKTDPDSDSDSDLEQKAQAFMRHRGRHERMSDYPKKI
jgi:hypothetical protein